MFNFTDEFWDNTIKCTHRIIDLYNLTKIPYKYMEEFSNATDAAEYDVLMLDTAKTMGIVSETEHTELVNHVRGV